MRITVHIKLHAPRAVLEPQAGLHFVARLTSKPVDNEANKELIKLLADYFDVPQGDIQIVQGLTSREKVVEILGDRLLSA